MLSAKCRPLLGLRRWLTTTAAQDVHVQYLGSSEQGIAVITLNNEHKNAIGNSFVTEMARAIDTLKYAADIKVVILRSGVAGVFCAGANLKERAAMSDKQVEVFVSRIRDMNAGLERVPMPTIAAIDGVALGGGLEIALACDMRIVTDTAKLGLVETKLAIIPGSGGTQRLPRLINPALAKELIYTGRTFSGRDAQIYGIANYVVQQNENDNAAYQKALDIAREILPNGPLGVRMAKLAIDSGLEVDSSTGYAIERACYAQVIPSKDRTEGLLAFAQKRRPNYTGE